MLGHSAPSVEDALEYDTQLLSIVLFSYLHIYPSQLEKYKLITNVRSISYSFCLLLTLLTGNQQPESFRALGTFARPGLSHPTVETTKANATNLVAIAGWLDRILRFHFRFRIYCRAHSKDISESRSAI